MERGVKVTENVRKLTPRAAARRAGRRIGARGLPRACAGRYRWRGERAAGPTLTPRDVLTLRRTCPLGRAGPPPGRPADPRPDGAGERLCSRAPARLRGEDGAGGAGRPRQVEG